MARSKRCVLALGHEDGHVFPTRKPIGDRYADGEFRGRTLSIPGVTVPGNVPRCKGRKRFVYELEIEGQTVRVEQPERFVMLMRAWVPSQEKLVWELFQVADEEKDLYGWLSPGRGEFPHFRILDQEYGHLTMPEVAIRHLFQLGEEVREVKP